MAMLEKLPPPQPPSPVISSPKENAEKDIVSIASEDEGVATGASTSEENDEIDDTISRTTLDVSTPVAQSDRYTSSYSKDRRSAVSSSGFGLEESRSKENRESKDTGASLRDVSNEGTVSIPAPTIEAIGRKVVPLPDRESKKRFASATLTNQPFRQPPLNFPLSWLPPRSAPSNGSTVVIDSYSVPLKDDAPSIPMEKRVEGHAGRGLVPTMQSQVEDAQTRVEGPMGLKTDRAIQKNGSFSQR